MTSQPSAERPLWDDSAGELSIFAVVAVVVSRWKALLGIPTVTTFVAAGISLVLPVAYTATATFTPEMATVSTPSSALGGLAAQVLGVPATTTISARFYAEVLESRGVLNAALSTPLPDPRLAASSATPLLDLLDVEVETPAARQAAGRRTLSEMIRSFVDPETGIITLSVEARYPGLAADIANTLLLLLDRFNQDTRRTQGAERRRFIQARLSAAEGELHEAEGAVRAWLEANRQFQQAPQLVVEFERLQRQVRIKEEVVTTLRRQFEEARIQEVNDTPVITVIDAAVPPQERSRPKRKLIVMLAFLLSGAVTIITMFVFEMLARARERYSRDYRMLVSQWSEAKSEARSLLPRRQG